MPKNLQGAYWQQGLQWEEVSTYQIIRESEHLGYVLVEQLELTENVLLCQIMSLSGEHGLSSSFQPKMPIVCAQELTNAYGIWDPKIRKLIIETWKPRNWGAHDTSSRIASGKWYWLPSGASHLNFLATLQASCDVFSDEVSKSCAAPASAGFTSFVKGLFGMAV